jgi:hypothetical protein
MALAKSPTRPPRRISPRRAIPSSCPVATQAPDGAGALEIFAHGNAGLALSIRPPCEQAGPGGEIRQLLGRAAHRVKSSGERSAPGAWISTSGRVARDGVSLVIRPRTRWREARMPATEPAQVRRRAEDARRCCVPGRERRRMAVVRRCHALFTRSLGRFVSIPTVGRTIESLLLTAEGATGGPLWRRTLIETATRLGCRLVVRA